MTNYISWGYWYHIVRQTPKSPIASKNNSCENSEILFELAEKLCCFDIAFPVHVTRNILVNAQSLTQGFLGYYWCSPYWRRHYDHSSLYSQKAELGLPNVQVDLWFASCWPRSGHYYYYPIWLVVSNIWMI